MIRVLKVIKDINGKHIGADIAQGCTMRIADMGELRQLTLDNAVVSGNIIRAKGGSLPYRVANNLLCFYHGNKDPYMKPQFGLGRMDNDYGQGFYTTQNIELAKEWAYSGYTNEQNNCIHTYTLDISDLYLFDFDAVPVELWVAELLKNRLPDRLDTHADWVHNYIYLYHKDLSQYDIIAGYRADDSYFSYMRSFASGSLFMEDLQVLLKLGKLGEQYCFRSERAISALRDAFTGVEGVPKSYGAKYRKRDESVKNEYNKYLRNRRGMYGHTILDYIRSNGKLLL